MVESDTADGCKFPAVFFGEGRLGCGRSGHWPAMSPSGFGGNPSDFDRRSMFVCLFELNVSLSQ